MKPHIVRVLKWQVRVNDSNHDVPGRFLAAAAHDTDVVNVWTEVDPHPQTATYRVFATGQPLPPACHHVATVQAPPYVWHLYQTGPFK